MRPCHEQMLILQGLFGSVNMFTFRGGRQIV
jgi:hypothetical protein